MKCLLEMWMKEKPPGCECTFYCLPTYLISLMQSSWFTCHTNLNSKCHKDRASLLALTLWHLEFRLVRHMNHEDEQQRTVWDAALVAAKLWTLWVVYVFFMACTFEKFPENQGTMLMASGLIVSKLAHRIISALMWTY